MATKIYEFSPYNFFINLHNIAYVFSIVDDGNFALKRWKHDFSVSLSLIIIYARGGDRANH